MPILDRILPGTNFGPGIPDIGPARLFSYILILAFFIEAAITKQIKVFFKWTGFIIAYSIVVLVSVSWSNYSYSSDVILYIFSSVLTPLMIVIIALNLFSEIDNIDAYIKNIIIVSFILSLMSLYQMLFISNEVRSSGTLGNPNALAIFLVLNIPCLIYALEKQMVSKKVGWVISASLVTGIICTVSRKGMVTGIVAFCLYYFFKRKFKKMFILGVVVMTLTLLLSGYAVISKRLTQEKLEQHFAGKWYMTYAGWQMYKESPLIGLGYRGYYDNFGKYFPSSVYDKYDAHNIFITALTNYGLIGFIPFLGIFLYPLFAARKALKVNNNRIFDNTSNDLAIICISSIIPFMLNGWFAGALFYTPVLVILFYTNISLFLSGNI